MAQIIVVVVVVIVMVIAVTMIIISKTLQHVSTIQRHTHLPGKSPIHEMLAELRWKTCSLKQYHDSKDMIMFHKMAKGGHRPQYYSKNT